MRQTKSLLLHLITFSFFSYHQIEKATTHMPWLFTFAKMNIIIFSAVSSSNRSIQPQNRNCSPLRIGLSPEFQGVHPHIGNYQSLCRTYPTNILLIINTLTLIITLTIIHLQKEMPFSCESHTILIYNHLNHRV